MESEVAPDSIASEEYVNHAEDVMQLLETFGGIEARARERL